MDRPLQPLAGVAWFDVADPQSSQLDELARRFDLHELQIEDCRHPPQRAKAEEHDHYLFIVFKRLEDPAEITFSDLPVFLGSDFMITVGGRGAGVLQRAAARAGESQPLRLDRILYTLVDALVDEYLPVLDDFGDATSRIESDVLIRPDPQTLAEIFHLKRRLIEFRRITVAMREVVNAIMRREHGVVGDDLDPYFRDVYDHLVRTQDLIETYRDLLTGSLDVYLSAVANRTNEVMKVLTVYGTVALPLVIITGFFGMNLRMGWSEHPHGVWYASGLMAVSTGLVLLYFRRKGWF